MDIEKQVCTLQQAKRLKELGTDQKSIFFRRTFPFNSDRDGEIYRDFQLQVPTPEHYYASFTVAELFAMLPYKLKYDELNCFISSVKFEPHEDKNVGFICGIHTVAYDGPIVAKKYFPSLTQAEGLAKCLIFLLEREIITAKNVNEGLAS